MKKLLLVLAIGAFAACNDSATTEATSVDSTSTMVDTTTVAPMDTTSKMSADTSRAAIDTTKK